MVRLWNFIAAFSPNEYVELIRTKWDGAIEGGMQATEMESRDDRIKRLGRKAQKKFRRSQRGPQPATWWLKTPLPPNFFQLLFKDAFRSNPSSQPHPPGIASPTFATGDKSG
jgi:hypothetical protein